MSLFARLLLGSKHSQNTLLFRQVQTVLFPPFQVLSFTKHVHHCNGRKGDKQKSTARHSLHTTEVTVSEGVWIQVASYCRKPQKKLDAWVKQPVCLNSAPLAQQCTSTWYQAPRLQIHLWSPALLVLKSCSMHKQHAVYAGHSQLPGRLLARVCSCVWAWLNTHILLHWDFT